MFDLVDCVLHPRLASRRASYGTLVSPERTFQFGSATVNDFSHASATAGRARRRACRVFSPLEPIDGWLPATNPSTHTRTAIASIRMRTLCKCSLDESARATFVGSPNVRARHSLVVILSTSGRRSLGLGGRRQLP